MIALSAPAPAPAMTRMTRKIGKLGAAAAISEATAYTTREYIITFLRPIRSPR